MEWNERLCIEEHQSVCTVLELVGFGETTEGADDVIYNNEVIPSLDEFKAHLRYCVEQHDDYFNDEYDEDDWANKSVHRTALITAYTVHTQPVAEGFLRELGFNQVGPISKAKHPTTKLSLWTMPSLDFLEAIKE